MDPSPSPQQFQIVVAHHNEDLSWLHQYAKNTVVYSKGRPPPPPPPSSSNNGQFHQLQTLPNIGRESHTIAHHLYHAYNNLADVTMFTQGDIYNKDSEFWPHSNLPLPKMVAMALATPSHGMTSFAAMKATFRDWDGLRWVQYGEIQWLKVWASSLVPARLTPGEFWKYIHGEEHPTALHYHAHGLFAVRAESIRLKPRSFYARLLRYFEDLNTCNPEEGMYMERMWSAFFSESHIVRGKLALVTDI